MGAEGKDVHGDVGESEKNRIRDHYPDILVTTPESLEVMLISARPEAREMLKGVRLVIIDEIHALRSRQDRFREDRSKRHRPPTMWTDKCPTIRIENLSNS